MTFNVIAVRKQKGMMLSEGRESTRPSKCTLYSKAQGSFYDSHSAPDFALNYIANNGIVLHASQASNKKLYRNLWDSPVN